MIFDGEIRNFVWSIKGPLKSYFPYLIFDICYLYNMYINMFSSFEIQYQPVKEK